MLRVRSYLRSQGGGNVEQVARRPYDTPEHGHEEQIVALRSNRPRPGRHQKCQAVYEEDENNDQRPQLWVTVINPMSHRHSRHDASVPLMATSHRIRASSIDRWRRGMEQAFGEITLNAGLQQRKNNQDRHRSKRYLGRNQWPTSRVDWRTSTVQGQCGDERGQRQIIGVRQTCSIRIAFQADVQRRPRRDVAGSHACCRHQPQTCSAPLVFSSYRVIRSSIRTR